MVRRGEPRLRGRSVRASARCVKPARGITKRAMIIMNESRNVACILVQWACRMYAVPLSDASRVKHQANQPQDTPSGSNSYRGDEHSRKAIRASLARESQAGADCNAA